MHFNPKWLPQYYYHQVMRSMPKGERDHQLLSERPSCKLNALSPHSATLCTRGSPRPYASVRPSPLLEPTRVSGVSANQRGPPPSSPIPPITPPADREAFVCLLTLFPPFIPIPVPLLSLSTDDDAATTSPSTPTRSSSRSRGANSMTYCRHCSRGLTKKAKFSHNVP